MTNNNNNNNSTNLFAGALSDPYFSVGEFIAEHTAATARNEARRDAEAPNGRKWWNGAPARVRRTAPAPRPVIFDPWMD